MSASILSNSMNRDEVIAWLQSLTDKQFIEVFYAGAQGRNVYKEEQRWLEAHLILANATRLKNETGEIEPWQVEIVCHTPEVLWDDSAPLCQEGYHCGLPTTSWAKRSKCPICGDEVLGT